MKKKILSIVLAGAMSIGLLAGCGESTKEADHGTKKKDQEEITVINLWRKPTCLRVG